jgi:signal transduction histidine kinase
VCYAGEIRQVIANLIGNAIDAMPAGGTLMVRAHHADHWNGGRQRGMRLTIADTGSGISADVKRHMFEPFFTTKSATGTGLGLWVSSELVRKHGGTIRSRSSVRDGNTGTVFTIFLPSTPLREPPGGAWQARSSQVA